MGLKSGFRVTLTAGMERAIEIKFLLVNLMFEIPIECRCIRGLIGEFHCLMFFNEKIKSKFAI